MTSSASSRQIHLWCPELFGVGGIQSYSRSTLDALIHSDEATVTRVLSSNDENLPAGFEPPSQIIFSLLARNGIRAGRMRYASALFRAGMRQPPDLVIATHLHFAPVARWLQRLVRTPYWTILYGVEAWNELPPSVVASLRAADRLLAISRFTRDRAIARHGLDGTKIHLLPNAIDATRFQPAPRSPDLLARYGLKIDQPIVLTIGRMESTERYKGFDEILSVFPDVLRAVPNAHYVVIGQGDDRPRLEARARQLGLQASVTFADPVPPADLCDHYNLCDLFAMPSRGEGFGFVFLEALACGKPVLAGNRDGSTDPLRDGELGILVDPDNTSELRDAIIAVLLRRHPHPHIFRPQFLREQVITYFGVERFRDTLDAYLRDFFLARAATN